VSVVRRFVLHPSLGTRVASIDIVENDGGQVVVLPSTSTVLGLQFSGRVKRGAHPLSLAGVTGLQDAAQTYSYAEGTGSVLVRFTAQGAACLGVPAGELTKRSVALDELLAPARVAELSERLMAAPDDAARVALVEQLLVELPFARDPVVTRALARLSDVHAAASVADIARELEMSERQLERRFVARVGLMPKRFARLARFERALALVRSGSSLSWVAQCAGYADQPHMVREFRSFAGEPPSALRVR
jgi:AraC-like DNA-binding protein